jgi:Predicted membrane protein/domain
MKKLKITTPENIEVEYTLADIGSRVAANVIDMLVQTLILIILVTAVLLMFFYARNFWDEYYGWIVGIGLLIYSIISYGYYIFMELSMNGMTLGKKLLNLRTIRNNGQPLTLKHSAIRNLFKVLLDNYGLGIAFIFFSKEHKRLGDLAASTIVIVEKNNNMPITLDNLYKEQPESEYYITEEEQKLLEEYFERRSSMQDYSQLREELKKYFTAKFTEQGVLEQRKKFIDEI